MPDPGLPPSHCLIFIMDIFHINIKVENRIMNPHISTHPYSSFDNYQILFFYPLHPIPQPPRLHCFLRFGGLSYPGDFNLLIHQLSISFLNTAYESGISKFIKDLVYA